MADIQICFITDFSRKKEKGKGGYTLYISRARARRRKMGFLFGSSEIWSDGIHYFRNSLILSSWAKSKDLLPFEYTKRKKRAGREEILRLRSGWQNETIMEMQEIIGLYQLNTKKGLWCFWKTSLCFKKMPYSFFGTTPCFLKLLHNNWLKEYFIYNSLIYSGLHIYLSDYIEKWGK